MGAVLRVDGSQFVDKGLSARERSIFVRRGKKRVITAMSIGDALGLWPGPKGLVTDCDMKLTHRIVCGRTRSGKLIYEMLSVPQDNNIHPEHRDFSPADHFDAYAVFSYLVVKTARELGLDAPKTERYDLQAKNHRQIISDRGLLSDLKRDAQVVTLIDLIHFAKNLVWIGYRIDD